MLGNSFALSAPLVLMLLVLVLLSTEASSAAASPFGSRGEISFPAALVPGTCANLPLLSSCVERGNHVACRWRGGGEPRDNDPVDHQSDDDATHRRPASHRHRTKPKSMLSSMVQKSVQLTAGIVSGTVQQSSKAAYYLVQPKHVERDELLGLWRLDQVLSLESSVINLELTAHEARVVFVPSSSSMDDHPNAIEPASTVTSPWKFTPARWPSGAKIEFVVAMTTTTTSRGPTTRPAATTTQRLLYKAVVHRKLAARHVVKLKGKIYRLEPSGWRGKTVKTVEVGTFVARRRLQLLQDDDEYDETIDFDEEDEDELDGAEEQDELDVRDDVDERIGDPNSGSFVDDDDDDSDN